MAAFELEGIKAYSPSVARNPLTLSSDAAKQEGFVLQKRESPSPLGAAKPLENESSTATPTKAFIVKNIEEKVGTPSPQRKIKEQLLDTAAGLLRKQNSELGHLSQKLPSIDIEAINRERLERLEAEKRRKEAEEKNDEASEPAEVEKFNPLAAEAAKAYRKLAEVSTRPARSEDSGETPEAIREREKTPPRKDLASGGASSAEKGDPGVNVVA